MNYFYTKSYTGNLIHDIFIPIQNHELHGFSHEYNFAGLAQSLYFILSGIPLPLVVTFCGKKDIVIYDKNFIYTIYAFFYDMIPLKSSYLSKAMRMHFEINHDMYFSECSQYINILFEQAAVILLDIYGDDAKINELKKLYSSI